MLTRELMEELRLVVGKRWFLTEKEDLATYSYDGFIRQFLPDAVVLPGNRDEVSGIMKIASREKIRIIPRGAGTNLSGTSVARQGGIIMALNRLNRILEVDRNNRCAVVQPGVVNGVLQKEVAKVGLMYGPDPASMMVSTIGGNVALNAGGPKALKYGVTRDSLMGLELVLPDGDVIRTGGKTIKNVTGFDLTRLLCGSEGTLGIMTEIIIRLVPRPPARRTMLAVFQSLEDVAKTVSDVMASGLIPAAIELMERVILEALRKYSSVIFPEDAEAILLVEVDGEESSLPPQMKKVEQLCKSHRALGIQIAETDQEIEMLWQARRAAGPALNKAKPTVFSEDATVPVSSLPEMISKIAELRDKHRIQVGVFAHAGDGNLHPCIMTDMNDKEEMERVGLFVREMFEAAVALGGTLSGEHGIGIAKDGYMGMEYNQRALEIMRGIKRVFDPDNILNPGSFL